MILLLALLSLDPGIMVEDLDGVSLHWRELDSFKYAITLAIDGESVSGWVSYPQSFNPAKLYCVYYPEDMTLRVTSQMPYSANYTFSQYQMDEDFQLTLCEHGDGDYYGDIRSRVKGLLDEGYMEDAVSSAMDMMYPGALPYPEEFCAMFVIAAAAEGTPEAFAIASDVSRYFLYCGIEDVQCDSEEYLDALEVYYLITERNLNDD